MGWWSSLRRKGRRLAALPSADRAVLVRAAFMMPCIGMARRFVTFAQLRGWLGRAFADRDLSHDAADQTRALEIAHLVEIAAAHLPARPNCLERSLVLWALLGQRGIGCDLRFGVRRDGAALEAHAWVERGGVILNDLPDRVARFTVIATPR